MQPFRTDRPRDDPTFSGIARCLPSDRQRDDMFDSDSIDVAPPLTAALPRLQPLAGARAIARPLAIAALVSVSLAIRMWGLGAASLAEDEVNKLRAAEAYDRGDLSANAEHPLLMKAAIWASRRATQPFGVSPEAAVRLPNALAGAATTGVVFLLAESLFDTAVGGWAAAAWTLDLNAAAINRIAKEDTFLLFFLLLASYWFERAKRLPRGDPAAGRWYRRSAAGFGLMAASKYMPHYFGLHAVFNYAADDNPADKTPDKRWTFYAAVVGVFLLANAPLLLPSTWHYLAEYVRGDTLRHTGYRFAHQLFVNTMPATPWGLPWRFYLTFFATKVPLASLVAGAIGLVWVARHPSHRGATFVRVFLVLTLLPYSLVASKFVRYMLPMLAVVDIAAGVGAAWIVTALARRIGGAYRAPLVAACALCFIAPSAAQIAEIGPYYGLAQNAVGARLAPRGSLFPDDELYDAGMGEAVAAVAAVAARGAVVCSDATEVVGEYLARHGRPDVTPCSIAHDGLPMTRVETWVIAQDGHTYFESDAVIDALRRRLAPWRVVRVAGVSAVQVYRVQ